MPLYEAGHMNESHQGVEEAHESASTHDEYSPYYPEHADISDYPEVNDKPRLYVGRIYTARGRLRGALDDRWVGQVTAPAIIKEQILPAVQGCIPLSINEAHIHTTLIWHLNGVKITKEAWDHLSTRLAGNLGLLRDEGPLTPSPVIEKGGWALLEIAEAELYRSKAGNAGAMFNYRVLSGRAAAYYFRQFVPLGYLPLYGKNLGVGRSRWWKQPRLYVGMKMLGKLGPAQAPRQLYVERCLATSACMDINRYYARGRSEECINNMHHPCWQCPRGLLEQDKELQCEYATHRHAWRRRTCQRCGNLRWFYAHWDPKYPCLSCREVPVRRG